MGNLLLGLLCIWLGAKCISAATLKYSVQLTTGDEALSGATRATGFRCDVSVTQLSHGNSQDTTELYSAEIMRCQMLQRAGQSHWIAHRPISEPGQADEAGAEQEADLTAAQFYGASNLFMFEKFSNGSVAAVYIHEDDEPRPLFL